MSLRVVCRLWWMLIALGLAAAGSVAAEPVGPANGGFELVGADGRVVGWRSMAEAAVGEASVAPSDELAHAGIGSIEIRLAGHGAAAVESEPVALEVGQLYRLSAWVRSERAVSDPSSRYPTAVPAALTMASFPFTNHSPAVGGDSDWTRVETMFIATAASDRVRLHLGLNGSARGAAWFDEVELEKVEDITEYIPLETVRWAGDGFRYDDRGWIFVHIEGEPYPRGRQYGELVAEEIAAYIAKLGTRARREDPAAGWQRLRFEADALFLRGFDEEYLLEMRGIADGVRAAGVELFDRPAELLDIVALNSVVDLGQLERALEVTPHSLTGEAFLDAAEEMAIAPDEHKCSAFAATGPATASGEVVFGQIFMWNGYTGVHWNVICDLEPSAGYRLVYQTFPGGIHSGADFYINSAGIVIGETTVEQTPWEPDSTPQSNRIRRAAQYGDSIDRVAEILWQGNNGMYTNDWPIADVSTGEVAVLLLGTHAKRLWRTGDDVAPFGLPGFLWANNNNRDPEVRAEYAAQPEDRPYDLVFSPWNRDLAFNEFYRSHAGSIDVIDAVELWASSPVNRAHACDGKITTSEMAREMVFLAHAGKVTLREKFPSPGSRIMPDLPGAEPHLSLGYSVVSPVFVAERLKRARAAASPRTAVANPELEFNNRAFAPAVDPERLWKGTVHPASERDNWFVSASAAYWRMLRDLDRDDPEKAAEQLARELFRAASRYQYTVSREQDLAAVDAHRAYDRYGPYRIPRIKGTFCLHQLHLLLGTDRFLELMSGVHRRFAGRPLTTEDVVAAAEEVAGRPLAAFIGQWTERTGLPRLTPTAELRAARRGGWDLELDVVQEGEPYHLVTRVEVEAGGVRQLHTVELGGGAAAVVLHFAERPTRCRFNALEDLPAARERFYTWGNFIDDFHHTLIVYGTSRQIEANHTLARRWQETVADAYAEILPPLAKDAELDPEAAATHDLMVLGSVADNHLLSRIRGELPVTLGRNHFSWQGEDHGAADDGLILVLPNPYNPQRVLYLVLANSAMELHRMTASYPRDLMSWARFEGAEVVDEGWFAVPGFGIDLEGLEP